jgi:hypothetical protein
MGYEVHVWMITSKSPLMQSNPASICEDDTNDDTIIKTKKKYDDDEECEMRVYRNEDGQFIQPTCSFRKAISLAVSGMKFGNRSARMVVTKSVYPVNEFELILNGDGQPIEKYVIDIRSVVIGKARIRRARPKFPQWSLELPLEIDAELVSIEQVTEALKLAGKTQGIGEFRPDPSGGKSGIGTFGRFDVEFKS